MYAVFETGGKQYRATAGDVLRVEKLAVEEGKAVSFDKVLLVSDGDKVTVGAPYVKGGKVKATVLAQGRDKKVKIVKFRRRKHSRKQMGHRQAFTELKIEGVTGG